MLNGKDGVSGLPVTSVLFQLLLFNEMAWRQHSVANGQLRSKHLELVPTLMDFCARLLRQFGKGAYRFFRGEGSLKGLDMQVQAVGWCIVGFLLRIILLSFSPVQGRVLVCTMGVRVCIGCGGALACQSQENRVCTN